MRLVFALTALLWLLAPAPAFAVMAIPAIIAAAGYTTAAYIATIVIAVGQMAYSAKQKRKQDRAARDAYNAGLQDRLATAIAADVPYRYVIGECRVGTNIVFMGVSGDKDQYQHVIAVLAHHEVQEIGEIYINGKPIGAMSLDATGDVTQGSAFFDSQEYSFYETHTGPTFTLDNDYYHGLIVFNPEAPPPTTDGPTAAAYLDATVAGDGRTVTLTGGYSGAVRIAYVGQLDLPRVRVKKHLGAPGEAADAALMAELPALWTADHVLPNQAYLYLRLDLNKHELQDGPPTIQADVKGMKLYDVRTGATTYNNNVANAIYWYLTSELCNISAAMIPLSKYQAAANVCDEPITGGLKRYEFNGTITSDQQQSQVLKQMVQAMAGGIDATTWDVFAGKYVAPVRDFQQEDIIGGISIVGNTSSADIFNGVRGQFSSPEISYVVTDFTPYQNAAYRAADGVDLYTDLDFPFSTRTQHVHNISRIITERNRNGLMVTCEVSAKAWDLSIGDRIRLHSEFWGWTTDGGKVFIVENIKRKQGAPVELVLQEDAPEIWDDADAVTIEATPNTNLPDPYEIAPITGLSCYSGTDALLLMADGTVVSRIHAQWDQAPTESVVNNGQIEVEWARIDGGAPVWQKAAVSGGDTSVYLSPVSDQYYYVVRARSVNSTLNIKSQWVHINHLVIGKTDRPGDVPWMIVEGDRISWGEVREIDLAGYTIRYHYGINTSWGDAHPLHDGVLVASPYNAVSRPQGIITLMIKAVDTTGNESASTATAQSAFGDNIVANIVEEFDFKAGGFAGTISGGTVSAGDLIADSTATMYRSDAAYFYLADSSDFFVNNFSEMTYETNVITPSAAAVGSNATLAATIAGDGQFIEYRNPSVSSDYIPWPGQITAKNIGYQFRFKTAQGATQGAISECKLVIDVPDVSEKVNSMSVAATTGTRATLSRSYAEITNVQATLQYDGGTAVSVEITDKGTISGGVVTAGPLIKCKNSSGSFVSGTVDVTIQGY